MIFHTSEILLYRQEQKPYCILYNGSYEWGNNYDDGSGSVINSIDATLSSN